MLLDRPHEIASTHGDFVRQSGAVTMSKQQRISQAEMMSLARQLFAAVDKGEPVPDQIAKMDKQEARELDAAIDQLAYENMRKRLSECSLSELGLD